MPNVAYDPFRINNKNYYVQKRLGSDGYFASAFLAVNDKDENDRLVIKLLHPASVFGEAEFSKRYSFAYEAVILSSLENLDIDFAVKLLGISPACIAILEADSQLDDAIKRNLSRRLGEPYYGSLNFLSELETTVASKERITADLARLAESQLNFGIPYWR
jgi:hypothetical protein